MYRYYDGDNHFAEVFNPANGFYLRTGVFDENGKDTGVDPFMRNYPALIDIGVMNRCVCAHKCNVDCYQKAIARTGDNMSVENYRKIMEQCKGKVFQVAIGGAGDPDTHEHFEEILRISHEYGIVPNFTTSGIAFTKGKAELCKEFCGAVAVSEHFADYTENALNLLIEAGVKTNIHFVLSDKTIGIAIDRLKNNGFHKGISAVVFLTYKNIGLGKKDNLLRVDDPRVKEFFELVDKGNYDFKIGFDSCACPGIVNFCHNINMDSIDHCEAARFSCYIDADMNMMPCSFDNQDMKWAMSLNDHSIKEIWDSEKFEDFRKSMRYSCAGCKDRAMCAGGCPIVRDIVLCNREEKELV